jgi:hypothetical protein
VDDVGNGAGVGRERVGREATAHEGLLGEARGEALFVDRASVARPQLVRERSGSAEERDREHGGRRAGDGTLRPHGWRCAEDAPRNICIRVRLPRGLRKRITP